MKMHPSCTMLWKNRQLKSARDLALKNAILMISCSEKLHQRFLSIFVVTISVCKKLQYRRIEKSANILSKTQAGQQGKRNAAVMGSDMDMQQVKKATI